MIHGEVMKARNQACPTCMCEVLHATGPTCNRSYIAGPTGKWLLLVLLMFFLSLYSWGLISVARHSGSVTLSSSEGGVLSKVQLSKVAYSPMVHLQNVLALRQTRLPWLLSCHSVVASLPDPESHKPCRSTTTVIL